MFCFILIKNLSLAYRQCTGIPTVYWYTDSVLVHRQCAGIPTVYWYTDSVLVYRQCTGIPTVYWYTDSVLVYHTHCGQNLNDLHRRHLFNCAYVIYGCVCVRVCVWWWGVFLCYRVCLNSVTGSLPVVIEPKTQYSQKRHVLTVHCISWIHKYS